MQCAVVSSNCPTTLSMTHLSEREVMMKDNFDIRSERVLTCQSHLASWPRGESSSSIIASWGITGLHSFSLWHGLIKQEGCGASQAHVTTDSSGQVSVLLFLWFFNISMNYFSTLMEQVFVGKIQFHCQVTRFPIISIIFHHLKISKIKYFQW